MRQVHYLYTYTRYEETLKDILKDREDNEDEEGKVYIKPQIEAEYITLGGKSYPTTWPWEVTTEKVSISSEEDYPSLSKLKIN
jgi:hypothetical protein